MNYKATYGTIFCILFFSITLNAQPYFRQPEKINIEKKAVEIGFSNYSSDAFGLNLSAIGDYKKNGSLAQKLGIDLNFIKSLVGTLNSDGTINTSPDIAKTSYNIFPMIKYGFIFVPSQLSFLRRRQYLSTPRDRQILENETYIKSIYAEHIRLYLNGGVSATIGVNNGVNDRSIDVGSASIPYAFGLYASLGAEFTFNDIENTFGSFFVEIGGAYTTLLPARHIITSSIPLSGLVITLGLRFYPTH